MNKPRNRNSLCVNDDLHFSPNPELSRMLTVMYELALASNYWLLLKDNFHEVAVSY